MTLRSLGHSLIYLALVPGGECVVESSVHRSHFSTDAVSVQAMNMTGCWNISLHLDKHGKE